MRVVFQIAREALSTADEREEALAVAVQLGNDLRADVALVASQVALEAVRVRGAPRAPLARLQVPAPSLGGVCVHLGQKRERETPERRA